MSRAEYQRQRRAAKRAQEPRPDHLCEACGEVFEPLRSDARFCSAACRAARWRPITHHTRHPESDGAHTCLHGALSGVPCGAPATWRHESARNVDLGIVSVGYYCEAHIDTHCPPDAPIGGNVHVIAEQAGRRDRTRHGVVSSG
jgi:hypothetical protein